MQAAGQTVNISESGACIRTLKDFPQDSEVTLRGFSEDPFSGSDFKAEIIWKTCARNGYAFGVRFLDINRALKERIRRYLDKYSGIIGEGKGSLLKLVLAIGVPSIPISALALCFIHPTIPYRWLFASLITLLTIERTWETFFTSREKQSVSSSEDWSITAVSFYYILMMLFTVYEFFLVERSHPVPVAAAGLLALSASFLLRWQGMKALGDQWRVHATETGRHTYSQSQLITNGPYKFVRHPIYLGTIIELIAIPLIVQSYYTLLFVVILNVPLQVLRSRLEEKKSMEIWGFEYVNYMNEVPAFLPNWGLIKRYFSKK